MRMCKVGAAAEYTANVPGFVHHLVVHPHVQDRIFYDDILPPTGSQQISFARLLQLLADRRVKRITLLADGKVAIVEVGCCSACSIGVVDFNYPYVLLTQCCKWQSRPRGQSLSDCNE